MDNSGREPISEKVFGERDPQHTRRVVVVVKKESAHVAWRYLAGALSSLASVDLLLDMVINRSGYEDDYTAVCSAIA